jgi:hypothetical protein
MTKPRLHSDLVYGACESCGARARFHVNVFMGWSVQGSCFKAWLTGPNK